MSFVAHAGHWAVQLIYLFPLVVIVALILVGRLKDRRDAGHAAQEHDEPVDPPPR